MIALLSIALLAQSQFSQYEPLKSLTPGATNPALTLDVLTAPGFKTGPYRNVPLAEKKAVFKEYNIPWAKHALYEVDHLISLEIGGSNDITNLWPQPYNGKWNAHIKDRLEDWLAAQVRHRAIDLPTAQNALSGDWVASYLKYIEPGDK